MYHLAYSAVLQNFPRNISLYTKPHSMKLKEKDIWRPIAPFHDALYDASLNQKFSNPKNYPVLTQVGKICLFAKIAPFFNKIN